MCDDDLKLDGKQPNLAGALACVKMMKEVVINNEDVDIKSKQMIILLFVEYKTYHSKLYEKKNILSKIKDIQKILNSW